MRIEHSEMTVEIRETKMRKTHLKMERVPPPWLREPSFPQFSSGAGRGPAHSLSFTFVDGLACERPTDSEF